MATAVRRVHVLGCHYAIALSPLGSCSGRRFPVARVHKPPTRCLAQQAPPKARRGHGRGGEDADGRGDGAVGLRRRRFDPALPARHQPLRTKDDRCYDNEFADSLDADERQFYDSLTPKERAQLGVGSMTDFIGDPDLAQLVLRNGEQGEHGGEGEQGGDGGGGGGGADIALSMLAETEKQLLDAQRSISQDTKLALADMPVDVSEKEPRIKPGFFNYADPLDDEEDAEDEEGMGPLALQQLEEHRGIRDYTRRAVWELPMLSSCVLPLACF